MSVASSVLPEFHHEMANTRKVLARLPNDKFDWKIHERSNTIGWVAGHLADIPGWVSVVFGQAEFDVAPPGGEPYRTPPATSVEDVLARFDANVAAGRAILAAATDEEFLKPWSLLSGGQTIFTLPRAAVLRSFVISHSIHHRAHLCVYLRVNDVPVPSIYGPSADETGM